MIDWTNLKRRLLLIPILLFLACGGGGEGGSGNEQGSSGDSIGTPNNPVVLSLGSSNAGSLDEYGVETNSMHYKFTTGVFSGFYMIGLTSTTSDLSWDLYSNSDFINGFLNYCDNQMVAADEMCSITLNSDTSYYLVVENWDYVKSTYVLTIATLDPSTGCQVGSTTCFDFESGSVSPNLVMSGDAVWIIDTTNSSTGTKSFTSGVIIDSQTSCFEHTPVVNTSIVSFSVKTDTENIWDKLKLYIDNVARNESWSGNNDWQKAVFSVTAGIHTYKWCYEKDNTTSSGADTVWIDDIELN